MRAYVRPRYAVCLLSTILSTLAFAANGFAQVSGWDSRDIGAVGQPGNASLANGTYSVGGAGSDIWGTADSFHFLSQPTGAFQVDFSTIVRVTSEQFTSQYAKAGLMLRNSYDPSSASAILDVKPDGGVEFMFRAQDGGTTQFIAGASGVFPVWLQLYVSPTSVTAQVSKDGTTWTTIGSAAWDHTHTQNAYSGLAVTSHDPTVVNQSSFDNLSTTSFQSTARLPDPWITQDIGNVSMPGDASYSNGVYSIQGAGADIWGTADAFRFVYQNLQGANDDTTVFARLTGMQNTSAYAKAGLMIRESLDASAGTVILDVKPDGGVEFMARRTAGATMSFIGGTSQPAPAWLKLIRLSGIVSGYVSSDGHQWQKVGEVQVSWPEGNNYVGLAVTSHSTSIENTATFDNAIIDYVSEDIGDVGAEGSVAQTFSQLAIAGAGGDIWGTADAFHYVYRTLGNSTVIHARVIDLQNTSAFAKAGLMIRASTDANAAMVLVDVKPDGSVEFMARPSAGAPVTFIKSATEASMSDMGLQLVYDGTTVTAYARVIDTNAPGLVQPIGSVTMSFSADALIGFAVTSHQRGTLNTAHFDQFNVE